MEERETVYSRVEQVLDTDLQFLGFLEEREFQNGTQVALKAKEKEPLFILFSLKAHAVLLDELNPGNPELIHWSAEHGNSRHRP